MLFGAGGIKPPNVISWEDSPELRFYAELMEDIAAEINKMISEKELKVLPDGTLLEQ